VAAATRKTCAAPSGSFSAPGFQMAFGVFLWRPRCMYREQLFWFPRLVCLSEGLALPPQGSYFYKEFKVNLRYIKP